MPRFQLAWNDTLELATGSIHRPRELVRISYVRICRSPQPTWHRGTSVAKSGEFCRISVSIARFRLIESNRESMARSYRSQLVMVLRPRSSIG